MKNSCIEKEARAEPEWSDRLLFFMTAMPALLQAVVFLFLGVFSIIGDLHSFSIKFVYVLGILILIGATLIYSVFRPYVGGYLLLICVFCA